MKRIVIKVGTALLTEENNQLDKERITRIVREISTLQKQGREIILVTSGSIVTGKSKLNLNKECLSLPEKQAMAAVGQVQLMHIYSELFARQGCLVAQVLLTREDFISRERYLNIRNTLLTLLRYKVIPVINENDTVAVEEIKFGDNDNLSALVASKVEANLLLILTDVEGLFTADPSQNEKVKLIPLIKEITPKIEKIAQKGEANRGVGGMFTKIQSAKIATSSQVTVVIADGKTENVITRLVNGENLGTRFLPKTKSISHRKRWIAFGAKPSGKIIIDEGAEKAILEKGRSLLPAGITKAEGDFERGDIVSVFNSKNREIGRGLVSYSSQKIEKIKGVRSEQIQTILGCLDYEEVIHRNNLVIL